MMNLKKIWLILPVVMFGHGCATGPQAPDLGGLYNRAAQHHGLDRNPVIVIPGVMGSQLAEADTGRPVWGAFSGEFLDPKKPEGARLAALPMAEGKSLAELTDGVVSVGALDRVRFKLLFLPVEIGAYANILGTLGVGGYRDEELGMSGAIDYGEGHYTCFQFHYDWRRSNAENAAKLHAFIAEKRTYVADILSEQFDVEDPEVEFDIVAHSMGGLITRYMLRYGDQPLPEDGSLPELTWAGAEGVGRAILVGTPSGGSVEVMLKLETGLKLGPIATYRPAVAGTYPSLYELMPRPRHGSLVDARDAETQLDSYDPALWEQMEWGLADPDEKDMLAMLLPDIEDPARRREVALDHQRKCLENARQFHAALDVPATPPASLKLDLVAGDAIHTSTVAAAHPESGELKVTQWTPGDGTVPRYSALMDERKGGEWQPHLVTPIGWSDVTFIFRDHLGMTKDPMFTDNILYRLLEAPAR